MLISMPIHLSVFISAVNSAIELSLIRMVLSISCVILTHFKPLYCKREWGTMAESACWTTCS